MHSPSPTSSVYVAVSPRYKGRGNVAVSTRGPCGQGAIGVMPSGGCVRGEGDPGGPMRAGVGTEKGTDRGAACVALVRDAVELGSWGVAWREPVGGVVGAEPV